MRTTWIGIIVVIALIFMVYLLEYQSLVACCVLTLFV